ncbi:MAG TPA: T9SS type A sorting domain-containing protein, partial [Flavobacteriia bacterium]|nr:T9SS type A sorting domain-containing protein [Flavobacteriia bacterium]
INYVQNSYKSYGNNGNCYNKRIDDATCSGDFNFTLRSNLYLMSDHLPVVAELQSVNTLYNKEYVSTENLLQFDKGNLINETLSLKVNPLLINHQIEIYNSIGQKIVAKKITHEQLHISTSNFDKGIYFIKVTNIPKILKFVKR